MFEPTSDARHAAAQLWNLYVALEQQGFSPDQAMAILLTTIMAQQGRSR